jgi:predicted phosphodiesterase
LPYHDKSAIEKAVKKGKDRNADCIYLNGDIMDCYQISKHQKDKRKRSLKYEIDLCKEFFRILRLNFPNADIYYKFGNHESRYDRYLSENAEALKEFEEIQLDELLQLNNYGIKLVPANILAKAYDLYIAHGHEYKTVFASGFYAARNTRIRSGGANIITGHHHRPMMDTGVDIAGERSTVNCLGCLCDLSPDWLGLTQWQHGFGFIEQAKNKTNVENIVL